MIFKLTFSDKTEFANANNELHLLQEYYKEYGEDFLSIATLDVITDEEAKTIMLTSNEPELIKEFPLYDVSSNDGFFNIIGSTEWD